MIKSTLENKQLNNLILRRSKKLNIAPEKDKYIKSYARKNNKVLLGIIEPLWGAAKGQLDPDVLFGIDSIFDNFDLKKTNEILFLINTFGGYKRDSIIIAKLIRRLFSNIKVFIINTAMSGGTLLSLIADEIIMGRIGHMSPLDSQIDIKIGKDEESVSAKSFSSSINRLSEELKNNKNNAKSPVYKKLLDKIDLRSKDEYDRKIIDDVRTTEEILILAGYNKMKAHKIADKLVNGYLIHDSIIDYYEANKLGLRVKQSKEYPEEWQLMKYWFMKYSDKPTSKVNVRYVIP